MTDFKPPPGIPRCVDLYGLESWPTTTDCERVVSWRRMIITLKNQATSADADQLFGGIDASGLKPLLLPDSGHLVAGTSGRERVQGDLHIAAHSMIESVTPVLPPYKLVSRQMHPHDTVVDLGGVPVGGHHFAVIAGPCAIESHEQFLETACAVKKQGAHVLRGGAFKPRTSPYSFQGLGREGLKILRDVGQTLGLPTVTEVVEVADVACVGRHASAFQVGARNMQNFRLLQALGRVRQPVLLKRGPAARIEDLLLAAEYIVAEGNPNVILCERGIKTFETATRNTLDLNAIPFIKQHSHLPVLVDPSHGTGLRELVVPMALAAAACGADGLIVEVHRNPAEARSDGDQSLFPEQFARLMEQLDPLVTLLGRSL